MFELHFVEIFFTPNLQVSRSVKVNFRQTQIKKDNKHMTIQQYACKCVCVCVLICSNLLVCVCGVVFQRGGKTFVYSMLMLGMKDISSENSFVRDLINIMLGTPPLLVFLFLFLLFFFQPSL